MLAFATLLFASALSAVHAHGTVVSYIIDGKQITGYLPYVDPFTPPLFPDRSMRALAGNGPVDHVDSPDIRCGAGSKPAKLVETISAGSTMQLHWTAWDPSHKGPVITWLARAPDGTDVKDWDLSGAQWFKIAQAGWDKTKGWPSTDQLFANDHNWPVQIPSELKAGQYVLRHELVALHQAFTYPGSQFYPNCIQLEVTGSGDKLPTQGTVSFPGGYKADEPGMVYNIYMQNNDFSNYIIPGGPVWDGTSSSIGGSSSNSSTPAPSTSSSPAPATTSSAAAPAGTSTSSTPVETYATPTSTPAETYATPTSTAVETPATTASPAATTPAADPATLIAAPSATPTTVSGRCRRSGTVGRRMKKSKRAHKRAQAVRKML